jgi:hypothetical protein
MTIRLLTPYPYQSAIAVYQIPAGAIVDVFDTATETGLIAGKMAQASVASVTWTPPDESAVYNTLTDAQMRGLRDGNIVDADGGVHALTEAISEVLANPSATTQILTGAGEYFAYRCTVAAGNITIYDNTASSGKLLVPTTALALGTFPIFGAGISKTLQVDNGIRVVLSGAATVYISRLVY